MQETIWSLYVVRCADGSLYVGIATDVARRIEEHRSQGPRAAKYLRGRAPLRLALAVEVGERGTALRLERRVKRLPKAKKEAFVTGRVALSELMGDPFSQV